MPCCGKSTSRSTYMGLPGSPRFTAQGVIELASINGCTELDCLAPYAGKHRNDLVYLVGWGTEHERLFRKGKEAAAWANHLGGGSAQLRNDRVMASELPARAVRELFGE